MSDSKKDSSNKSQTRVIKQKRKNPHPVRQYFKYESSTQQRCRFCNWITRENATRMVKHIAYQCASTSNSVRLAMQRCVQEAKDRESNSSFTEHNKKDIHSLFNSIDMDKRQCLFCGWTTRLNLTRMRHHIISVCKEVPAETRNRFIKVDTGEDYSSFSIINVDLDDRKGFEIVSSKSLQNVINTDMNDRERFEVVTSKALSKLDTSMDEMSNDNDEARNQDESDTADSYYVYGEFETEPDQQQELETIKQEAPQHHVIAEVIVGNGADGEEYEEQEQELMDDAEENDEPLEPSQIEFLDIDQRECHWCQSTLSEYKAEYVTDGKVFCSLECKILEDINNRPKTKEPEKMRNVANTRTYSKIIMTQERSAEATPCRKKPTQPPTDDQTKVKNALPVSTFSKPLQPIVGPDAKTLTSVKVQNKIEPAKMIQSKVVQPKAIFTTSRVYRRASLHEAQKQQSAAAVGDEGSCHSFGGGHVYPQEAPRFVDHKLQYTKAVISRPAPEFEATAVVDGAFKKIKLSDYRGKYLVFFFYPLDFTFVCPTEILAFSDRVKEFKKLNAEVIAASIDSHFTHLAWINTPRKEGGLGQINIPLVSDITHSIAKDYGVYLDDLGHTLRGLFIIDDRGVLRQITMNDLPVGRSVDETLRLVQAFQYTDKHGEVCPAGWKPGQDTIVPNPEAKIKYFEKNH
ncbi:uncharacterized protein LOC131266649 [Anopheles coustani]|uniref:uncharacterized protein LOC131266649 n=1 Tax=Anopheles coustani TaxID=139045 RepID=UPI00265A3AA6|nr:uncharacterized protein LOC131266649 [Anopheles coustani]